MKDIYKKILGKVLCIACAVILTFGSTFYAAADTADLTERELSKDSIEADAHDEEQILGETLSDEIVPDNIATDETLPEETLPDETVPEEITPDRPLRTESDIADARSELESSASDLGFVPGEILVSYHDSVHDEKIEETAEMLDGEVDLVIENGGERLAVVDISDETTVEKAIKEYEADPDIAYAEPNYILVNMDEISDTDLYAFDYLDAVNATGENGAFEIIKQKISSGDTISKIKPGIIDTGFDLSLLQGKYDEENSRRLFSYSEGISGQILSGDDFKGNLHGTNVADVLIKSAGDSLQAPVLVDAAVDDGNYTVASVAYAINYLKSKVKVINMSLGTLTGSASSALSSAVRSAYSEGVIMVCAAGNGSGTGTVYPSDYSETISVMSVNESFGLWEGSGFGSLKDIAAPGTNIRGIDGLLYSGTSLSAPMVTGAVCMLLSAAPSMSFPEILDLLLSTADRRANVPVLDIGNAIRTVTGAGTSAADIANAVISPDSSDIWHPEWAEELSVTYRGHALENKTDFVIDEKSEVLNEDGTVTLTVTISGKNNYCGTKESTFTVNKVDVSNCLFRLDGDRTLTGNDNICPDVALEYRTENGKIYTLDPRNYTVSYGANNTPGSGSGVIHISGSGYAFGERDIHFDILSPESVIASGSCGDNAEYVLYADGSMTISGTGLAYGRLIVREGGKSYGGFYDEAAADDLHEKIKNVEVGQGITGIGDKMFEKCANLTEITLPDSVGSIGQCAFSDCIALKSIVLPDKIRNILPLTFYNCASLESINIPEEAASIGSAAFSGCSALTEIVLPEGMTEIGREAFRECKRLGRINIPAGVKRISYGAFIECASLKEIIIPEGVTAIEGWAFTRCSSLTSISLPDGLESIDELAFYGCESLGSIHIPDSVKTIGESVFCACSGLYEVSLSAGIDEISESIFAGCKSLKGLVLPQGITCIGDYAFYGCSGLENIVLPDTLKDLGKNVFEGCESLKSFVLPEGITEIKGYSFRGCSSLKNIDIPDTVKSIGEYAFSGSGIEEITFPGGLESIGESAFRDCDDLTEIELPDSVETIESDVLRDCDRLKRIIVGNKVSVIGDYAFNSCKNLQEVILPEGLKSIGMSSFAWCSSLENFTIPSGVSAIGKEAFYFCLHLETVSVPESIEEIGEKAFNTCERLTEISLPLKNIRFGEGAFYTSALKDVTLLRSGYINEKNCRKYFDESVNVHFIDPLSDEPYGDCGENAYWYLENNGTLLMIDGEGEIDAYSGAGKNVWADHAGTITEVQIGKGITSTGSRTFKGFTKLKKITLPDTLFEIGDEAFSGCSGLEEFTLSQYVTTIGVAAFSGCADLKRFNTVLNTQISSIGKNTFEGCASLEEIRLEYLTGLKEIGSNAFNGCASLKFIAMPCTVTEIGDYACYDCKSLERVYMEMGGENGLRIGKGAFALCKELIIFDITKNVTSVEEMTFFKCVKLQKVPFDESLQYIGDYAFYGCSGIMFQSTLPDNLRTVGDYAFYGCSGFRELILPESLQSAGKFSFADMGRLEYLTVLGANTSIGGHAFYRDINLVNVTLPDGFTSFSKNTFDFCEKLKPEYFSGRGLAGYEGARLSDSGSFTDHPEAETKSITIVEGITYKTLFGYYFGTEPPESSCSAIVSVERTGEGYYTVTGNAPGQAVILYKDETGKTLRYSITVKIPVESDPDNLYKEAGYVKPPQCPHKKYSVKTIKAATCAIAGTERYTCTGCGSSYDKAIPATGRHTYQSRTIQAATCAKNGTIRHTCTVCKKYYDTSIAATGNHNYKSVTIKKATCAKKGTKRHTCTVCGKKYNTSIPATGKHKYRSKVIKAATCSKRGTRRYTCTVCKRRYNVSIPATGKHKYKATVIKKPTTRAAGKKRYKCKKCGRSYTVRIPKLKK